MNVGTLTISLAARTAALTAASSRVKAFETGVVASAQRANRSLLMLGQTFSSLTIPIAALGITATNMFSDFEFSLAKVEGLVGIAADRVQEWGDQILQLASNVAKTPKDLGEALYFVTSAGIRGAETMDVLEKSALAASAGLGATKDVADAVTSAMNAYGKENLSAAEATDILIMGVREGKVVAEDLASSIGKVFPVAAQLEVSFNEVGAAIAAMTRTGTPASTSAIYLRRVLTSMLRPTNAASTALESMGTSFYEFRKTLEQDGGLLNVLLDIKGLVDEFGTSEVAEIFPNIRALIPVLDIIGKNLEDNKVIWENMLNPVGALDTAVAAVSDTFQFQFNQSVADLNTSMVDLGSTLKQSLLPIIQDVVGWIRQAINWWGSLDTQTQQLITRITLITAVIGPLTVIVGSLINALLVVSGVITSVIGQFFVLAFAISFAASAMVQFSKMRGAADGMEDGIDRTNTALENFSSNVGAYLAVALTKLKIFSIKIGIVFGDVISGIVNTLIDAINSLISVYNLILPGKKLDLPKFMQMDIGGYYQKQLKIAEDELKRFRELLPGGNQSWNWADQLFGKGSGFKDAASEVWQGFKDDAAGVINWVGDKLKGTLTFDTPKFRVGSGSSGFGQMGPFPFTMPDEKVFELPSFFEDLTKQWAKFNVQVAQANKQFDRFGFLVNPVEEKLRALDELLSRIRERGGPIREEDLNMIKKLNIELQNADAVFNFMKSNFEGLVSSKALENAYKYIDSLKLTKSEIAGMENMFNTIKGFNLFSDDTLLNMAKGIASLGLTEVAMKRLMGVASFMGDMFAEIGVGLGKAAAGAEGAFEGVFNMIVDLFKQIGSLLTKAGTILLLIPGFQGWGAAMLLGGIGLSAIGGFIEESHNSRHNAANMASGGIIPGGFPNDTFPANLSSGEAVIPLDRLPQLMGVSMQEDKKVVVHISGRSLVGVLDKQSKVYNAF